MKKCQLSKRQLEPYILKYNGQEIPIDAVTMASIKEHYEVQCTAEYIAENYTLFDDELILDLAHSTRDAMMKYDLTETEALQKSLEQIDDPELIETYIQGYEFANDYNAPLTRQDREFYEHCLANRPEETTIRIYQISSPDLVLSPTQLANKTNLEFRPKEDWDKQGKSPSVSDYHLIHTQTKNISVSDDNVKKILEDIYREYNTNHPSDFRGHSLSVSDVVDIKSNKFSGTFFCDSFGFKEIPDFHNPSITRIKPKGRR